MTKMTGFHSRTQLRNNTSVYLADICKKIKHTAASWSAITIGQKAAEVPKPLIHFGFIASGDLAMKLGYYEVEIATKERVIAFEMEGTGI